jgi:hypothetical protein
MGREFTKLVDELPEGPVAAVEEGVTERRRYSATGIAEGLRGGTIQRSPSSFNSHASGIISALLVLSIVEGQGISTHM